MPLDGRGSRCESLPPRIRPTHSQARICVVVTQISPRKRASHQRYTKGSAHRTDGLLPAPKASLACDRVPLSRDRDRILPQKPSPQFFFFVNRRSPCAAPRRARNATKAWSAVFLLCKSVSILLCPDHRFCADPKHHPERLALDFQRCCFTTSLVFSVSRLLKPDHLLRHIRLL